jgi:fucose permease
MQMHNLQKVRWLTYMMFLMFAMTTDAVGVIIPVLMKQYELSMTMAGLVHYAPMVAIALSGLVFGFIADKFGRKLAIMLGLALYAVIAFGFMLKASFYYVLALMVVAGVAIGIFKTAALALIGDISSNAKEHTTTVNGVEAFFGVGAIIGPLVVTYLLSKGVAWQWLYLIAGVLCVVLILLSTQVKYPQPKRQDEQSASIEGTFKLLRDPYALSFSMAAFLYVAVESAIYVWMPTFLLGYDGPALLLASYALTLFFVLRAAGRFLGMWMLNLLNWEAVLAVCTVIIALSFVAAVIWGQAVAVYVLPLSGLFMSVVYPTLNSKGISCFKREQHGAVAGVILFFTAAGAAFGPLFMGVVSDINGGQAIYGFIVASVFAVILAVALLLNWRFSPTDERLALIESDSID